MEPTPQVALVGPGRAGTAISQALRHAGWPVVAVAGRSAGAASTLRVAALLDAPALDLADAVGLADVVVVATPDADVASVAGAMAPALRPGALVVHLAGSLGLEAFAGLLALRPDVRTGALHPLQTLPGAPDDHERLTGAWFAVEGDPAATDLALAVGGHPFAVADRALYHAAAAVAANHVVALLGQVERLAARAGAPVEAFRPLVEAAVANAFDRGPAAALTGPVARGDLATVERHLAALPTDEHDAYRALSREAARLAGIVGTPA